VWTEGGGFGKLIIRKEEKYSMCLGIPAKVIQVTPEGTGKVDYLGTKVRVNFSLIEDIRKGDWVIVHAGFAISRLNEEEAQETLALLREISEAQGE